MTQNVHSATFAKHFQKHFKALFKLNKFKQAAGKNKKIKTIQHGIINITNILTTDQAGLT